MENRGSEATHLSLPLGGSCFTGPPTRCLHRQHRTVRPAENVDCRILIGVYCVAARGADKPRLAHTACRINHAADAAGKACICSGHFNEPAPALPELVVKQHTERMPSLIKNG